MTRKKKSKKKQSTKTAILLTAEERRLIDELIIESKDGNPEEIISKISEAKIAEKFIEQMPLDSENVIPLLTAIADHFSEKRIQKAIKKAFFRLKNQGINLKDITLKGGTESSILKAPEKEKPKAFVGPIDPFGFRAVLIELHKSPTGMDLGIGLISDEQGIQQFFFANFSKKKGVDMKDSLSEEAGPLIETSLSHATAILENAYKRHLDMHPEPPAEYLEIRPWLLEDGPPLDTPVIFEYVEEDQSGEESLTESQIEKLLDHELLNTWHVDFESLKPYAEEIEGIDKSPIVLNEAQKFDRTQGIKEKALEELFPDEKRALLKHRFEEMAFIFHKLGQEDYSKLSLSAAGAMISKDNPFSRNPIISYLIDKSLSIYRDALAEMQEEGEIEEGSSEGLIIS